MKKGISIFTLLLIIATLFMLTMSAFAGTGGGITAARAFTPSTNSYTAVVAGSTHFTVDVRNAAAIRNMGTVDCLYRFNGTGAPWLLKANTPETIFVPKTVTFLTFSSSVGSGVYNQRQ